MPTTKRGYDMYELLSALQKDIRRGNTEQALFWAIELGDFNDVLLWNRLIVIASEDIGAANPFVSILIEILRQQYFKFKQSKKSERRLFLTNAILVLSRSPKNRMVDDLTYVVNAEIQFEGKKLNIPDYALDMHTLRGKKMGRGRKHFNQVGCKLVNEKLSNPYRDRATKLFKKYGKLK